MLEIYADFFYMTCYEMTLYEFVWFCFIFSVRVGLGFVPTLLALYCCFLSINYFRKKKSTLMYIETFPNKKPEKVNRTI